MEFYAKEHVFEVLPPFRNNHELPEAEQLVIGLQVVTHPEMDSNKALIAGIKAGATDPEKVYLDIEEQNQRLIGSKVAFIKGLEIEGVGEVTDFETFVREAPRELVAWVAMAVMSTEVLMKFERKNFVKGGSSED